MQFKSWWFSASDNAIPNSDLWLLKVNNAEQHQSQGTGVKGLNMNDFIHIYTGTHFCNSVLLLCATK